LPDSDSRRPWGRRSNRGYSRCRSSILTRCLTFASGEIDSAYADCNFSERFARVVARYPECNDRFIDRFNVSLPLVNAEIDPEKFHAHTGPAVFGLLCRPRVLDLVQAEIGPEISSSPVQQMRIKPPLAKPVESSIAHSGVGNTT